MDLSLKQRLLGAAVLIALAVIFVPMFISTSAPRKSAEMETSNLAIPPAPSREFQTQELSISPPAPAPATPPADSIASVDTATAPPPVSLPTPNPNAVPEPVSPSKPSASSEPTPPVATPTPVPVPGTAANGSFFVHLGIYGETRNATDLVAALKKSGFAAFSETSVYKGKPAARVRVGPFGDRAAAEAARLRIKQLKPAVPGSVVQLATDAKVDAPAAALPASRAGAWAVQLGALKTVEDANKLRDRLKGAGFAAFVDKVDSNGTSLWRVRAGPEVDRGAADKLRASIKDKLKLDGMIVTQQ